MPLTLIMVKAEVKEKLQALIISSLWYNTKTVHCSDGDEGLSGVSVRYIMDRV